MTIIIVIIFSRKQCPERLSDLHKNRSHTVAEPEFNYRSSCLKALPCGPQTLDVIDLGNYKKDITLKSPPDCFAKGYVIHTTYSHSFKAISFCFLNRLFFRAVLGSEQN